MKKAYRIKKADEFTEIIKNRQFYKSKGIILYVRKRKEDIPRVGITVKKKIGNAVVRNKVKRQVRMMVQEIYSFEENFDSILLIREDYLENDYKNNKNNLERIVKQVRIKK
ncbi:MULTISPECIES: ribonuclease P protein component [unclassified Breznakia]|uniref:ribonuclease P protein component n=1 Tax=unclassified Breznakia TaxID=2623764 RepID=UPI0024737B94|nr:MULTISPECIES: ribonuclease P protein component [unclassified Breznakia]MDH6366825.1 ribonuclease P protein component [Breznakia sp. PH1-1]MDH6404003.1 ribonuclease P protein component [Breznakia sp. PF1-11]MDH6411775.1 ribonuclease P protein component [Breznakia sp. PFB1-11]MDH6413991.1 ribonuclease P protein component [Breznakia sp. PFB1-14]MDH6416421.1 ribonuclease P protein component [Breznakia sp. PFB1-4]